MKTVDQIAQWAVDIRFAKSENEKISDFELYQTLIEDIQLYVTEAIKADRQRVAEAAYVIVDPKDRFKHSSLQNYIVDKESILSLSIELP